MSAITDILNTIKNDHTFIEKEICAFSLSGRLNKIEMCGSSANTYFVYKDYFNNPTVHYACKECFDWLAQNVKEGIKIYKLTIKDIFYLRISGIVK